MGLVTMTTPLLGWFVIQMLGLNIVYMCAKIDDFSFGRSRDIIGAPKAKTEMGHVTMTTPR